MPTPTTFADESEHIGLLRETLRRFVAEEMKPEWVREWDREHRFPPELFRKLADLGVCGLTIEEEHGGAGRDLVAAVAVIEELCRAGSFAAGPFIHCAFYGGMNISENGSPKQKRELLPKLARMKRWCTGAEFADYIYCLVQSDADGERYRDLSFILVPTDLPGIEIQPIEHTNLRYTLSSDVAFDNVEVPIDLVVGGEEGWNQGWRMLAGRALDVEKLEISAVTFGIAQAAVEEAWAYAQQRIQFGKPISGHQAIRHSLVEARTRLEACRHMLYHAAWLANEGRPCSVEASMAKLFVADTAVEIVLACQRVMGAYGLCEGHDMERHVRDVLGMPIVGGSSNIQKNNIANRLGLAG